MLAVKDYENVFDRMFRFMYKSYGEEGEVKVFLLDIKHNLNVHFVRRLKNLANVSNGLYYRVNN